MTKKCGRWVEEEIGAGVRVIGNYVCGVALFYILAMVAGLLGLVVSGGDGEVAWRNALLLYIIFLLVVVNWAMKKKARGIVPGLAIAAVVHVLCVMWMMRGHWKA